MHFKSKLQKVFGVPQLFIKRTGMKIELLAAKVPDDFLVAGNKDHIAKYMNEQKQALEVGKIRFGKEFKFIVCEISTTNENTSYRSMNEYTKRVDAVTFSCS